MKICQGCGGVLGRDCFNEQECMSISQSQNNFDQQHLQQIQSELEWERRVVVPDLEQKLSVAFTMICDMHNILANMPYLSQSQSDYIRKAIEFYAENKHFIKPSLDNINTDDLPF